MKLRIIRDQQITGWTHNGEEAEPVVEEGYVIQAVFRHRNWTDTYQMRHLFPIGATGFQEALHSLHKIQANYRLGPGWSGPIQNPYWDLIRP